MLLIAVLGILAALVILIVNSPIYRSFAAAIDSWAAAVHGEEAGDLR
jgi:hypothetical protein